MKKLTSILLICVLFISQGTVSSFALNTNSIDERNLIDFRDFGAKILSKESNNNSTIYTLSYDSPDIEDRKSVV